MKEFLDALYYASQHRTTKQHKYDLSFVLFSCNRVLAATNSSVLSLFAKNRVWERFFVDKAEKEWIAVKPLDRTTKDYTEIEELREKFDGEQNRWTFNALGTEFVLYKPTEINFPPVETFDKMFKGLELTEEFSFYAIQNWSKVKALKSKIETKKISHGPVEYEIRGVSIKTVNGELFANAELLNGKNESILLSKEVDLEVDYLLDLNCYRVGITPIGIGLSSTIQRICLLFANGRVVTPAFSHSTTEEQVEHPGVRTKNSGENSNSLPMPSGKM